MVFRVFWWFDFKPESMMMPAGAQPAEREVLSQQTGLRMSF
jgi:hypothetical protein